MNNWFERFPKEKNTNFSSVYRREKVGNSPHYPYHTLEPEIWKYITKLYTNDNYAITAVYVPYNIEISLSISLTWIADFVVKSDEKSLNEILDDRKHIDSGIYENATLQWTCDPRTYKKIVLATPYIINKCAWIYTKEPVYLFFEYQMIEQQPDVIFVSDSAVKLNSNFSNGIPTGYNFHFVNYEEYRQKRYDTYCYNALFENSC